MIIKILNLLFPRTMASLEKSATLKGEARGRDNYVREKLEMENFEVERYAKCGPVIILSNEWQNPIVGKIVDVVDSPFDSKKRIAIVKDYITGEVVECYNTMMPFTMQKLKAIGKMTPDELCSFFFEGRYSWNEIYKKQDSALTQEGAKWTNYADWVSRMRVNSFFEENKQFKED